MNVSFIISLYAATLKSVVDYFFHIQEFEDVHVSVVILVCTSLYNVFS